MSVLSEELFKLLVTIGADKQLRCRKSSQLHDDARILEKSHLVTITTAPRKDTVYIMLTDKGYGEYDRLLVKFQKLLVLN